MLQKSCHCRGMILIRQYFVAIGVALFASSALAAPEDDYVIYKTAAKINEACGGMKYVEHTRTLGAAMTALQTTSESGFVNDGRMSQEDYDAWLAALDAKVDAQVQAVGCTEQAMQFIMRGKGVASEGIYRGLALSMHFAGAPATDITTYVAIEPDRMLALQRYDAYLQAIYRENFAAFAARQKEIAAQELPAANPFASSDFGLGLGSYLMSPDDMSRMWNAQSTAAYALDEVFFEVAAETAGFIVRPRTVQEDWTIPELKPAATPQDSGFTIVSGPGYDLIDFTPEDEDRMLTKLYSVLTLTPDNRLRAMFYGDAAAKLVDGTVRLYVRTEPLPAGADAYSYFASPGFREAVTGHDGVRVDTGCLTAACFDFAPEATTQFVADKDNQYAELFVSHLPGAEPEVREDIMNYKPGRVSNFYAYKLLRE